MEHTYSIFYQDSYINFKYFNSPDTFYPYLIIIIKEEV